MPLITRDSPESIKSFFRTDETAVQDTPQLRRFPERMAREVFLPVAYAFMRLSRRMEERIFELYRQGLVKGTVTQGIGCEAASIGAAMPLRPGADVVSLLHRDFGSHLLLGTTPYQMFCQYLGNAESPTNAREGNVHHGDAATRRFPMISHLGGMLSTVVGGVWSARRRGEEVFGLAVIGDGGTSTGAFHEAVNLASVFHVPMVFLIENNGYAFSTPTENQYRCVNLADRAAGYGIVGETVDGTDVWAVYDAMTRHLERMEAGGAPTLLEVTTRRLVGHAVYDSAKYVDPARMEAWRRDDPLGRTRHELAKFAGLDELEISAIEKEVEAIVAESLEHAMAVERPTPPKCGTHAVRSVEPAKSAPTENVENIPDHPSLPAYQVKQCRMGDAVRGALDYLLALDERAMVLGLDIGEYGSAFGTCKGLYAKYPLRVLDMPLCEAGITAFAIGASQTGTRPIVEYQFADFATDATTQIGLNAATWYWRSGATAPLLLRMPCGGGVTMGPFHSIECDGLWSRFPGLSVLYPATPMEMFESLVAGFLDPNPVCVLEHKQLYWSLSGEIDFLGNDIDTGHFMRPRCHRRWNTEENQTPGQATNESALTIVATGAMLRESERAVDALAAEGMAVGGIELWNPLVLDPTYWGEIVESVQRTGRLLVVQESGRFAGIADTVVSEVTAKVFRSLRAAPQVVAAPDEPVPFAPELENAYRPDAMRIRNAIRTF